MKKPNPYFIIHWTGISPWFPDKVIVYFLETSGRFSVTADDYDEINEQVKAEFEGWA